jgi:hypothetical protein
MFNIPIDKSPFEMDHVFNSTLYVPTSCVENNTIINQNKSSLIFTMQNSHLEAHSPLKWYVPDILSKLLWRSTDMLWHLSGWTKIVENGEHYWYYPNYATNKTTFYLHGMNALNGYENTFLLNQIKQNSSVYVSIYSPIMFLEQNYDYNNTFSEHVDNVAKFVNQTKQLNSDIIGNSYGSIRITVLCKRYPTICNQMQRIVLTDPVNINVPYSMFTESCYYGILVIHPEKTNMHINKALIKLLIYDKHFYHSINSMNWYEWTIDTTMMKHFSEKIILVIGKYDNYINFDKNSKAMQLCRVIYTDTIHGMVIFSNFYRDL